MKKLENTNVCQTRDFGKCKQRKMDAKIAFGAVCVCAFRWRFGVGFVFSDFRSEFRSSGEITSKYTKYTNIQSRRIDAIVEYFCVCRILFAFTFCSFVEVSFYSRVIMFVSLSGFAIHHGCNFVIVLYYVCSIRFYRS